MATGPVENNTTCKLWQDEQGHKLRTTACLHNNMQDVATSWSTSPRMHHSRYVALHAQKRLRYRPNDVFPVALESAFSALISRADAFGLLGLGSRV